MKNFKVKSLGLLVFFFSSINTLKAQFEFNSSVDTNFFEVSSRFYSNPANLEDSTDEGGLYSQFKKWQQFWAYRVGPTGNFNRVWSALRTYADNFNNTVNLRNGGSNQITSVNDHWTPLGPFGKVVNDNNGYAVNASGNGQMNRLELDPNNSSLVYATSGAGGLWEGEVKANGKYTWRPLSDNLPFSGCSDVAIVYKVTPTGTDKFIFNAVGFDGGTKAPNCIGVYRSKNGGPFLPFTTGMITTAIPFLHISHLLANPNDPDEIFVASEFGVFKTSNATTTCTWVNVLPGLSGENFRGLAFMPGNSSTVFASGKEVYKSTSSGNLNTWNPILTTSAFYMTEFPNAQLPIMVNLAVSNNAPNELFANFTTNASSTGDQRVWKFDGSVWTQLGSMSSTGYSRVGIAVSPTDHNLVFAGSTTVFRSLNGVWSEVAKYNGIMHADIHDFKFVNNKLLVACDGGIYKLDDVNQILPPYPNNELAFYDVSDGLQVGFILGFGMSETDADAIIIGEWDCGDNYTLNATQNPNIWSRVLRPGSFWDGDGAQCLVDKDNSQKMYASSNYDGNGFAITTDGWATTPTQISGSPGDGIAGYHRHIIGPDNALYSVIENIYKWNGTSWEQKSDFYSDFSNLYSSCYERLTCFAIAPSNTNYFYASTGYTDEEPNLPLACHGNSFIFKSIRGGGSGTTCPASGSGNCWSNITPTSGVGLPIVEVIKGIAVSNDDPNHVYFTCNGYTDNQKVFESIDGGISWTNISAGLPNLPVNCIVYENGSNDRIYVGTDAGVYTKDNTPNSQFVAFFDDILPHCIISQMDINYCSQKIRASTYGRGVWESPLASNSNNSFVQINSNVTWGNKDLITNLSIESGATLTVTGTLNIARGKKIVVKQGAQLIVDGGTLTNNCGEMWAGIEVWGKPLVNQNTAGAQGKLIVKNGATISNALDAVKLADENYNTGGIVQASNSNFINNQRSAEFLSYHFNSNSGFRNCNFEVNDQYRGGSDHLFWEHISMWDVKGVTIHTCTFVNNQTNIATNNLLGKGIFTLDANFEVSGDCNVGTFGGIPCPKEDIIPTSFRGFEYGIYSGRTSNSQPFYVHECLFEDNAYGISSFAITDFNINRNHFILGEGPVSAGLNVGIESRHGSGYRIEENWLEQFQPASINTLGALVVNSGSATNQIYRNTFDGLTYSNVAQGDNRGTTFSDGLQYLCNIQRNNSSDISVDNMGVTNGGIALYQGNSPGSIAAGNTFSQKGGFESDIWNHSNNATPIIYYYGSPSAEEPLSYTTSSVFPTLATNDNGCPSNYESGFDPHLPETASQQLQARYGNSEAAYLNLLYAYNQLIDGGNTNALLSQIELTWSEDAWQLRNELMLKSPYLSKDVLIEAAKTNILPQAMLLEICLANPDATKSNEFLDLLRYDIKYPFPESLIDFIIDSWDIKTSRTTFEKDLAFYNSEMGFSNDLLLTNMYLDSTDINHTDSIRYWLNRRQTISAKYELAESYFKEGNFDVAIFFTLDSIPLNFNLSENEELEWERYKTYMLFRRDIIYSGRNLMQLNETEIQTLTSFADGATDLPAVMVQNLLCFGYKICTDNFPVLPEGSGMKHSHHQNKSLLLIDNNKVDVAPNPALTYTAFTYKFPLLNGKAEINITDETGRTIQRFTISDKQGQIIWDTRQVERGIYIYIIRDANSILAKGKVVVEK